MRHELIPHPGTLHPEIQISVDVAPHLVPLWLRFIVTGDIGSLAIPDLEEPARGHALWEHTCFEAFLRHEGSTGYYEANVTPSGAFAHYQFENYRSGMWAFVSKELPQIASAKGSKIFELTMAVPLPRPLPSRLGVSAVIEEKSGAKSYWALAHPPEGPPDFHHPDCFTLQLPPAPAP